MTNKKKTSGAYNRLRAPTQCALWKHPELVNGPISGPFELLETYYKDSHFWRYLLRCRECGQRYFFEFYEEVDWVDGENPQYSTYLPVETDAEIAKLRKTTRTDLLLFAPRLQKDFPKGAKAPTLRWVR